MVLILRVMRNACLALLLWLWPMLAMAQLRTDFSGDLPQAGRGGEALPMALGVTRRVGGMFGADSVVAAGFLRDAAIILRRLGHVEEAIEAYRRIVPLLDSDPTLARQAASTVFLIADSLDMLGQGEASLAAFRDADARHVEAYGPRHSETLAVRLAHGRLALALGNVDEAAVIPEADLPVVAEVFGTDSVQYGTWLRLEARRLLETKRTPEAIAMMARAVAIIAARLPETHCVLAEARLDHARLLTVGKRYEDAWAQDVASEGALGPDRKFMLDLLQYRREAGTLTDASFPVTALPFVQRAASGAARGAVREQVLRRLIRDPAVAEIYRSAADLVEEGREVDPDVAALQALLDEDEVVVLLDQQRQDQEWSVVIAITRDDVAGNVFWQPVAMMNGWVAEVRGSVSLTLGTRAAEAHRLAMVRMIEHPSDPRWSHPAYWAPFVLVGSPD